MEHQITYRGFTSGEVKGVRDLFDKHSGVFNKYIDRLGWWNKKINLVSRDVSRETLRLHVEHSLVIATSPLYRDANLVVDTGTGGGLPGIPLAVVNGDKKVLLNDIVTKKIMACKSMVRDLALDNVITDVGSIEECDVNYGDGEVIVSKHAFKVDQLLGMLSGKPWQKIILLKGADKVAEEVEDAREALAVKVINLYSGFKNSFYEGKALVEIERRGDNE